MVLTLAEAVQGCRNALVDAGLAGAAADRTAYAIVLADAWGTPSHGLLRLPHYVDRLRKGGYSARAELRPVSDMGAIAAFDGEGGLGHWQVWTAAEAARERCLRFGVGVVAVGNSGHCGALGIYTLPALQVGLTTLVLSNGPAVMPPWGGHARVLSTSPLAAGIPTTPQWTIVDMATSQVARGRIAQAAGTGEPIPRGWAYAADGTPTTDAGLALAGMLAPVGGAKGAALALLVEALTGAMVGPALAGDVADMFSAADVAEPQRIAHLVLTLDPAALDCTAGGAAGRLEELARRVAVAGGRLPGEGRRPLEELDSGMLLEVGPEVEDLVRAAAGR